MAQLLKRALQEEGYAVTTASDGTLSGYGSATWNWTLDLLERLEIDLAPIVREVSQQGQKLAHAKNLGFRADIPEAAVRTLGDASGACLRVPDPVHRFRASAGDRPYPGPVRYRGWQSPRSVAAG